MIIHLVALLLHIYVINGCEAEGTFVSSCASLTLAKLARPLPDTYVILKCDRGDRVVKYLIVGDSWVTFDGSLTLQPCLLSRLSGSPWGFSIYSCHL